MGAIRAPFGLDDPIGTPATPATGTITVKEGQSDIYHFTEITIADLSLITPVAAANLASGKLLYTLPEGNIMIKSAAINIALAGTGSTCAADTPDLGLGTVVGTGAVAVLGGTATFENIMTGQTMDDCNGTAEVTAVNTILTIASSGAHTIYLNIADGWAGADDGILATGKVIIEWLYMD